MDRYWDEVDPLFFEQLKTLPFLRMYKKSVPNSASSSSDESTTSPFCFLNRVETDAFVDVIRMNRDVASCYLGPINDNQQFDRDNSPSEALQIVGISSRSRSAYNALLERYPAIGDLDNYRKQDFDYPTDLMSMVSFFERLQVPGLSWDAEQAGNQFLLNIDQGHAASFEHLLESLHANHERFNQNPFVLKLPAFMVSHRAKNLFNNVQEQYGNQLIIREVPWQGLDEVARLGPAKIYNDLTELACSFVDKDKFHALTQDGKKLTLKLRQLAGYVNHRLAAVRYFTCEFFVTYQLAYTEEIANLDQLWEAWLNSQAEDEQIQSTARAQLATLRKEITLLLCLNSSRLGQYLNEQMPVELSVHGKDTIATTHLFLQARAWWGMVAYHHAKPEANSGMYWYGCYLIEFPLTAGPIEQQGYSDALLEARKTGAYWLRRLAHHFDHKKARDYLMVHWKKIAPTASLLPPAERYQYLQVANTHHQKRSQKSNSSDDALTLLHDWHKLFPKVNNAKLASMLWRLEHKSPYSILFMLKEILYQKFFPSDPGPSSSKRSNLDDLRELLQSPSQASLLPQQFYLYSLIVDDLVSDSEKIRFLDKLSEVSATVYGALGASSDLEREQALLELYHEVPLGRHLEYHLLPTLNRYIVDQETELDSNIAMKKHPYPIRISAFCESMAKRVTTYLENRQWGSIQVAMHETPGVVANLIQNSVNQALDYFELTTSDFGKDIQEKMQWIQEMVRDDFLRYRLRQTSRSLVFKHELSKRLQCYQVLAHVANGAELKPLAEFGVTPIEVKKDDKKDKILPALATGVEALHFVLPVALVASGVGAGIVAATSAAGMILSKIHHVAHWIEGTLKDYNWDKAIIGLNHAQHLAHKHGFLSHGYEAKSTQAIGIELLRHFNQLLIHAESDNIDTLKMVIEHFAAVYRPITAKLSEQSNTALAALLVRLFFRGFGLRQARNEMGQSLPSSPTELGDFIEETLWLYGFYSRKEDIQLVDVNGNSFSALSVIFPCALKVRQDKALLDVALSRKTHPYSYQACPLVRYASCYEVRHINQSCENKDYPDPFALAKPIKNAKFTIAYQEPQTINSRFSLIEGSIKVVEGKVAVVEDRVDALEQKNSLVDRRNHLQELVNKAQRYINNYLLIKTEKPISKENIRILSQYIIPLIQIHSTLTKVLEQLNAPQIMQFKLEKFGITQEQDLAAIVQAHTSKVDASLILLARQYPSLLRFIDIDELELGKASEEELLGILGEDSQFFLPKDSTSVIASTSELSFGVSAQVLVLAGSFSSNRSRRERAGLSNVSAEGKLESVLST